MKTLGIALLVLGLFFGCLVPEDQLQLLTDQGPILGPLKPWVVLAGECMAAFFRQFGPYHETPSWTVPLCLMVVALQGSGLGMLLAHASQRIGPRRNGGA